MRKRDKAHSRLVSLLKVGLPLTALALLSTVFLLARTLDPEDALPWATVDIEELLRDPRLTAPQYAGVTEEGDEILFTAARAWPGAATGAHAAEPVLRLISPAGEETRAVAETARIEPTAGELTLQTAVQLTTAGGYLMTTEKLDLKLDRSALTAPGEIRAEAPGTQLEAGSMQLTRTGAMGGEVVVFKGGVRLLYQPQSASSPSAPPSAP